MNNRRAETQHKLAKSTSYYLSLFRKEGMEHITMNIPLPNWLVLQNGLACCHNVSSQQEYATGGALQKTRTGRRDNRSLQPCSSVIFAVEGGHHLKDT